MHFCLRPNGTVENLKSENTSNLLGNLWVISSCARGGREGHGDARPFFKKKNIVCEKNLTPQSWMLGISSLNIVSTSSKVVVKSASVNLDI